ncbi:MAG: hypothetical protein H7Y00_02885 [Fimbriimonadaceae bacterium]|nr:hypothetical protein [Chitinophagales bacterium]
MVSGKKIALICTLITTVTGVVALFADFNLRNHPDAMDKLSFFGSINKSIPIELEISVVENEITGFYKYTKYDIPIPVKGSLKDNHIIMDAFYASENKKEQFVGTLANNKILGQWTDYEKHYQFELSRTE